MHLADFPVLPARWHDEALAARWQAIRAQRDRVNAKLEAARQAATIRASLSAAVTLGGPSAALLSAGEWASVLIVSHVTLVQEGAELVGVAPAPGQKCERCWRVLPEVGEDVDHPALCRRCRAVMRRPLVAEAV